MRAVCEVPQSVIFQLILRVGINCLKLKTAPILAFCVRFVSNIAQFVLQQNFAAVLAENCKNQLRMPFDSHIQKYRYLGDTIGLISKCL